ncbi:MAG: PorT family protein [Staphylococcus sp.]|nr:PorT family protein [Staphylococcus sp.]
MKRQSLALTLLLLLLALPFSAKSQLIDYGKPSKFLDMDAHILLGGSYVTNNYRSSYREISDLNNSMGTAWGLGFGVKFNLTSFISLGTEFNYLRNSGKMDMAVTADGKPNVSNVFLKNSYRMVDIPIYISFGFNLARSIRWNVDGGMYLDFGTSGSQKATIYTASVNDLGQLTTATTKQKTDYYDNSKAFLNSFRTFDSGLHIATGLTFMKKVSIGVRGQFGFRNVAQSDGIIKPNCHNIKLFATAGYHF